MSDKKPEPKKRALLTRTPAAKPAAVPAESQASKASLRKKMRRMQAANMPKEEKAVAKGPGHPHCCNDCLKDYLHDAPKCQSIGLSWRVCDTCNPIVTSPASPPMPEPQEGTTALDAKYDVNCDAEYDALLNRMQTPEAQAAMKAAFDAPPGQPEAMFGDKAVDHIAFCDLTEDGPNGVSKPTAADKEYQKMVVEMCEKLDEAVHGLVEPQEAEHVQEERG